MKSKAMIRLMYGFSAVPVAVLALVYGRLPEMVPTNFGFDGSVNAYGPRSTLILLALLPALLGLMMQFLPRIDPKRGSYAKFQKYYDLFALFVTAFLTLVFLIVVLETLRPGTVSIGRLITGMVAMLLIIMGNMMGKVKHNYFFGIKTPWTLADPDVWVRTHSLGGRIWFILGILLLPACMLLPEQVMFVLLMTGVLLSMVFLIAISYVFYRQKERTE